MDRATAYPNEETTEIDVLNTNKFAMIGLGKLALAIIGTGPVLHGLPCTPGAGLTVQVAAGQIYLVEQTDATAYSSLGVDTHTLVKQGLLLDPVSLNCPAPTTAGQAINYLVQIGYQDADTGPVVLPFYNASNPTVPYTGPGGNGAPVATVRSAQCLVAVKAGTAAAAGSQTTPAVDAGFVAAYVVTVPTGATSVASGNIVAAANAPFLAGLLNSHHHGTAGQAPQIDLTSEVSGIIPIANLPATVRAGYYTDTGIANAYVVALAPSVSSYVNGLTVKFRAANGNAAASTLDAGAGPRPLLNNGAGALISGDLPVNGLVTATYDANLNSWLLESLVLSQIPSSSSTSAALALYQLGLVM
jgi:hypothetical protein